MLTHIIYHSYGISSGAISLALQMIGPDNGENKEDLFHSAFMQSGAAIPIGHIREGQVCAFVSTVHGNTLIRFFQKHYDFLLKETGCDTLNCLRTVEYSALKDAVDKSPSVADYQVR